jgi:transcriptional regulator with XRE-family HTH domain
MMKNKGMTQVSLAKAAGYKTQSSIAELLRNKRAMRLDNFVRLSNLMGYKVIVVPDNYTISDDEYVVTRDETLPESDS